MATITDNLSAATDAASSTVASLRLALKPAGAVEGLALLALIKRAAELEHDIATLRAAVAADAASDGLFWSDETGPVPLPDLLSANADDAEFCAWAREAAIGAAFHHHAGTVQRVA